MRKDLLPEDMLSIPAEELGNLLCRCSKGHLGINKTEEIQSRARESFVIKFAKRFFSFKIKQIIRQISFLEEQLREIETEISCLLEDICPVINTITGIGSVLGAYIVSEIGNISRFERINQLVAYAGLDTRIKQPGNFSATNTKLSERSSPYLRRLLNLTINYLTLSSY
ncbi:transposase [Peptostreptococcus stomatis]|uniref:transposase n=1 Tax=Peptostreptococcus stomatis TaxID=341694 RepID=UPI0024A96285|nr:transposase [Peptostreptococcus stomatis]